MTTEAKGSLEQIGLPQVTVEKETGRLIVDGKPLNNSFLLLPEGKIFSDWSTLRPVVASYVKAGYGHALEAYAVARSLADNGLPVIMLDLFEVVSPKAAAPLKTICCFYEKFQRSRFSSKAERFPDIPEKLLRIIPGLFNLFERSLRHDFERFLEATKASFVISTHPTPAGALGKSAPYKDKVINLIPDPFAKQGRLGLAYSARKGITTLTFDEDNQRLLTEVFGIKDARVFETPIPLGAFNLLKAQREKVLTEPERTKYTRKRWNVLVATSGSGGNRTEIIKTITDLAEELKKENSDFRLFVFVGTHKDLEQEVKELADTLGLKECPNLKIIASKNLFEVAKVKYFLQAICEFVLEKAGEPALIAPWLNSVLVCLGFTSPHEKGNWLTAIQKRGQLVVTFNRGKNALAFLKETKQKFEELFNIDRLRGINPQRVFEALNNSAPICEERRRQMEWLVNFIRGKRLVTVVSS